MKFPLTREALARYDAEVLGPNNLETDAVYTAADEQSRKAVRLAFYADTCESNDLENCMLVSFAWIREQVRKADG
jgi:hypothetical protein